MVFPVLLEELRRCEVSPDSMDLMGALYFAELQHTISTSALRKA